MFLSGFIFRLYVFYMVSRYFVLVYNSMNLKKMVCPLKAPMLRYFKFSLSEH